jgi:type I restriction enzyme S subunit
VKWRRAQIGALFEKIERSVEWSDDAEYRLVSIRRRSEGMFLREKRKGASILTKQLFVVRTGDVVISRMQIVHGAIAMVPPELDGACVSGTYLVLVPRSGAPIEPRFFDYLTRLPQMYHAAFVSSYGVHIEKMTFNPEWYLETRLTIPESVDEQVAIADTLDKAGEEIALLERLRDRVESYKRGVLSKVLGQRAATTALA